MASGYRNASGADFDTLFDFYQSGTKPSATGFRTSDGVDLNQRYAPIILGSKGPNVSFRTSGGVDLSNLWAAKGTSSTSLPIDGDTFTADAAARGHAQLDMNMKSDGTYTVVRSGTSIPTTTLASGTWLPSGQSAALFTVQFVASQSGATIDGGTNSMTNGAPSQAALTSTRTLSAMSDAPQTSDRASANTGVTLKLFKSGVLISTTLITFQTNANGN